MRTTVTIDAATERLVKRAMTQRGASFKQVLNDAVQRGLADLADDEEPFKVDARPMRARPGVDVGKLNALADELETADYLDRTSQHRDRS